VKHTGGHVEAPQYFLLYICATLSGLHKAHAGYKYTLVFKKNFAMTAKARTTTNQLQVDTGAIGFHTLSAGNVPVQLVQGLETVNPFIHFFNVPVTSAR
jgi:hypothetical protein